MANGITVGKSGTFNAQLLDNGQPVSLPLGGSWTWTTSDPEATVAVDPAFPDPSNDPTGASVTVTVPATDTATTITVTASATDPTGATQSGSITVPITPATNIFTVSVTQTA